MAPGSPSPYQKTLEYLPEVLTAHILPKKNNFSNNIPSYIPMNYSSSVENAVMNASNMLCNVIDMNKNVT